MTSGGGVGVGFCVGFIGRGFDAAQVLAVPAACPRDVGGASPSAQLSDDESAQFVAQLLVPGLGAVVPGGERPDLGVFLPGNHDRMVTQIADSVSTLDCRQSRHDPFVDGIETAD